MHLAPSSLTLLLSLGLSLPLSTASSVSPHHTESSIKAPATPSIKSPSIPSIQSPSPPSPSSPKASAALTHKIATLIASDASASLDPSTCPPSHASKQCCTSIGGVADDIVGENGLGGLVPYLSGVEFSSLVGLQCMSMREKEDNGNCLDSVQCCSLNGETGAEIKPGTQSISKSACIPYDEAIEAKKEAIEMSQAQASYLAASRSSTSAVPRASALPVNGRA
ncbi:uncharacterized protein BDV17DRAFT_290366 [Aspergillus undulatus]|uniref:uncharacterized protein n=1 Tax=Aspergillus undulatus TaxID=1810928 RepID=UPI003CCC9739